jgi:hypothetical protein
MYGKEIEVTDLSLAMIQADDFRHYATADPGQFDFFQKQQAYWEDVYEKLLLLDQDGG